MPNWTSNRIHAEAAPADLRAFLVAIKGEDEILDFNRIVPMPEILKHTGTGKRNINGKTFDTWYVIKDAEKLKDEVIRPFTSEEEALLCEIGHRDWYSWSCENWGTKWNARHIVISASCEEGHLEIRFYTAWASPYPIFQQLFEMFPGISLTCSWQHEDDEIIYSIERPVFLADDEAPDPA